LLEGLQAGIAGQLAALDDAGRAAVSLLRVPVSDVAAKLTGHLIWQIQIRSSHPAPPTPLADQLNQDQTHLQVQRLEGQGQRIEESLTLRGPRSPMWPPPSASTTRHDTTSCPASAHGLYAPVEKLRAAEPRPRAARYLAGRYEVSTRTIERDILASQEDRDQIQ
jgi:hypothetical protein